MEALYTVTLLLAFLLPGFLFRRAFFVFSNGSLNEDSIYEELLWAIPISALWYIMSIIFLNKLVFVYLFSDCPKIDIGEIISLFSKEIQNDVRISIQNYYGRMIVYFISINLCSYYTAKLFQRIILQNYLDEKFDLDIFNNRWYDVFGARKKYRLKEDKRADFVEVTVLCNINNEEVAFKGFLYDYFLNGKDFDYITLTLANRFNPHDPQRSTLLPGLLIIKNSEIKNIVLKYTNIDLLGLKTEKTTSLINVSK